MFYQDHYSFRGLSKRTDRKFKKNAIVINLNYWRCDFNFGWSKIPTYGKRDYHKKPAGNDTRGCTRLRLRTHSFSENAELFLEIENYSKSPSGQKIKTHENSFQIENKEQLKQHVEVCVEDKKEQSLSNKLEDTLSKVCQEGPLKLKQHFSITENIRRSKFLRIFLTENFFQKAQSVEKPNVGTFWLAIRFHSTKILNKLKKDPLRELNQNFPRKVNLHLKSLVKTNSSFAKIKRKPV